MNSAVAVCGTEKLSVESGVALVRAAGSWNPVAVFDSESLEKAKADATSYVLVSGSEPSFVQHVVVSRPPDKPLIAIGSEPVPGATCWLPAQTPPTLLSAVLGQLVGERRGSGVSFRRKGDMIIGGSPAIKQLLTDLNLVTPSPAPVVIFGESGTGKDLVAQAIHYCGPRAKNPFIAINCGAIPESLFEAELFGYVRGAFTGATTSRAGAIESAQGGTLFLDEVGELPLALQVKLLRVLETRKVTRLGSNEEKPVDFRLVSATNRDMEGDVAAGRFRQDLFYRLRVFTLRLPPLRERAEDIPAIVLHQLDLIAEKEKRPVPVLTHAALHRVLAYNWPGNVRELINALHRALVICGGNVIDAHHLDLPDSSEPSIPPYSEAKAAFEAQYYSRLLKAAAGNVSLAAKLAQKTRKEVYDALKRIGLSADGFR